MSGNGESARRLAFVDRKLDYMGDLLICIAAAGTFFGASYLLSSWTLGAINALNIAVMTPLLVDMGREIEEINRAGWRRVSWLIVILVSGIVPGVLAFLWLRRSLFV
jgi:hypothetical protein